MQEFEVVHEPCTGKSEGMAKQRIEFEFDNTFGGKLCIKENYELQIF